MRSALRDRVCRAHATATRGWVRRTWPMLAALVMTACASGAEDSMPTPPPVSIDSLAADVEGFVIQSRGDSTFRKTPVGTSIWNRAEGEAFDYFGPLEVEGVIQIDTPPGTQYATWFRFEKRLTFVVKDLRDGSVQRTSHVDGGWNLARQGVSVQMAPDPSEMFSEEAFNAVAPTGMPVRRHFVYSIDDHLPTLYAASTTLEIHAEYRGLRSNTIVIRLDVEQGWNDRQHADGVAGRIDVVHPAGSGTAAAIDKAPLASM